LGIVGRFVQVLAEKKVTSNSPERDARATARQIRYNYLYLKRLSEMDQKKRF
jgi:hypothetical protein